MNFTYFSRNTPSKLQKHYFFDKINPPPPSRHGRVEEQSSVRTKRTLGPRLDREKRHPKRRPKIDAEKVLKNDAKLAQKGAKMGSKITDVSVFSRKGDFVKMCTTFERQLDFRESKAPRGARIFFPINFRGWFLEAFFH